MSTYTPIASQTLTSSAASVTFSSIPQGYNNLVLVTEGIGASGSSYDVDLNVRLNNDTGSNYSFTYLYGNGSSTNSGRGSNTSNGIVGGVNDSGRSMSICHFNNYSNTTTYKTFIARINRPTLTAAFVNSWRSTSAISTIYLYPDSSKSFAAGFTFTLYGIQVGDKSQKAQGGNIVTSDGTYMYHAFTSSGSFIPNQALTNVDYLVVAGGGAGGAALGGGGGAGGLRSTVTQTGGNSAGVNLESKLSLSSGTAYLVAVGAGAPAIPYGDNTQGITVSGSNSIFSTITALGGGGGGSAYGDQTSVGATGGSGGGGAGRNNTAGGSGTANQGYGGGLAGGQWGAGEVSGGGGGGAGATGANCAQGSSVNVGGAGGAGVQITALATATGTGANSGYYAGGGGGWGSVGTRSAGGLGGGGDGGTYPSNNSGISGTTNTGGGGGGTYPTSVGSTAGNGGSGIVIIRYAL